MEEGLGPVPRGHCTCHHGRPGLYATEMARSLPVVFNLFSPPRALTSVKSLSHDFVVDET